MRTFIAITLPEGLKKRLGRIILNLSESDLQAKWVAPDNLHITLKFLGEVKKENLREIAAILREVGSSQSPLRVNLAGFDFFPSRGRPRVLFVKTDQQERLGMIATGVENKLAALNLPVAGRFQSHITLARFKGSRNLDRLYELIAATVLNESFSVTSLVLYKSTLSASGASYEVLYEAPFTA